MLFFVFAFLAPLLARAKEELQQIVIVTRHGVRSQFLRPGVCDKSEYAPGKYFATPAEWGTENAGELTPHGYQAVKQMGKFQSNRYSALFKNMKCDDVFVYTDEDQRDIETTRAFFEGVGKPECMKAIMEENFVFEKEDTKAIIDQGAHELAPGCGLGTEAEVRGRWQNLDELKRQYKKQFLFLSNLIGCCDRAVCKPGWQGECTLLGIDWEWEKAWFNTFQGPLYCAKYYSEWFLLTYLNNMEYAWGELSEEDLLWLSIFVTKNRDLEFDILAAESHGSTLLTHVLMSLEQKITGKSLPGMHHDPEKTIVYYGAHDTNVLYLKELLGLSWLPVGWQYGQTPPGGHIVFELYKDTEVSGVDGYFIKAFYDVQKPWQIRQANDLTFDPPSRNALEIPGCPPTDDLRCSFQVFKKVVLKKIRRSCVVGEGFESYVDSNTAEGQLEESISIGSLITAIIVSGAAGAGVVLFMKRNQRLSYVRVNEDQHL